MWTILIALLITLHILPERLSALLAHEHHLHRPLQLVRLLRRVALGAVEPLLAAWRADRHLRVEDVFTAWDLGVIFPLPLGFLLF